MRNWQSRRFWYLKQIPTETIKQINDLKEQYKEKSSDPHEKSSD
jgi:hypothetical protein